MAEVLILAPVPGRTARGVLKLVINGGNPLRVLVALALALSVSACGHGMGTRAATGGLLGAGGGAVVGSATGLGAGTGAVLGGLGGAGVGAATAHR